MPAMINWKSLTGMQENLLTLKPKFFLVLFLYYCCNSSSALAQDVAAKPLILVAMAPIYQLTQGLLKDTDLDLQLLPESPRSMEAQRTVFTRQAENYAEIFQAADVVISIGKIWPGDPFYTTARDFNVRVVNIDASKPWSHELDGVAVTDSPVSHQLSPYFWLSSSNVIRVLEIVGHDLQQLYPAEAATIKQNLVYEKASYVNLKNDFEQRFIEVADPFVFALADEFVYFTSDMGIFVDDYFVKQDIDWTPEDYSKLTTSIKNSGVKVVIHKWQPTAEIQQAITAGGATLVVLDTLETTENFKAGFVKNFDAVLAALLKAGN
ncbi:MAG: metal ABC transporter solute-binding protein, Zn/Mn family [Pseudohongiellaceae bacterium]